MNDIDLRLNPVDRPGTLAERAREQLRVAIMAGRFEPGAKLTIRSVSRSLDISLTPAREALYSLVSEGTLELGPNGTVSVPVMDAQKVRELLVIRIALEGAAAREAAPKLDSVAAKRIRAINDRLVEAYNTRNFRDVIELNWHFHFEIYRLAEMPTLTRMIETCWLKTGSYLHYLYPDYGRADIGIRNHINIIEGLENGDTERFARAVEADIETAGRSLLDTIRGLEESSANPAD
ncbi:GntR family transcriptional regulator [Rhodospira trueperi]|uniref:DNA-binding transcriptional regulator, GntR family n=1 Tax=Rhodospira trueperi TaxID=69960 RepID=A0A1G7AZU7_9PROT|nr:GntR family transcriptional regulator [Rhodospira trueperi]SDE20323.1 DNA-binding transcriptional regulator, GntR family [Rhodospira trueperi]